MAQLKFEVIRQRAKIACIKVEYSWSLSMRSNVRKLQSPKKPLASIISDLYPSFSVHCRASKVTNINYKTLVCIHLASRLKVVFICFNMRLVKCMLLLTQRFQLMRIRNERFSWEHLKFQAKLSFQAIVNSQNLFWDYLDQVLISILCEPTVQCRDQKFVLKIKVPAMDIKIKIVSITGCLKKLSKMLPLK